MYSFHITLAAQDSIEGKYNIVHQYSSNYWDKIFL